MFGLQEIVAMNQPGAKAPVNTFTIHRPEAKAVRSDTLVALITLADTAQRVIDTWAHGDLAAAVNDLELYTKVAREVIAEND